jgi:Nif11 domain
MTIGTDAKAFYDLAMNDATLQEQLKEATSRASLISIALNLGAERGYDFTADEANSLIDSSMASLNRLIVFLVTTCLSGSLAGKIKADHHKAVLYLPFRFQLWSLRLFLSLMLKA